MAKKNKVVFAWKVGEDLIGSLRTGMAWAKIEYPGREPVTIRLHPLDCALSKWPYGWPPVVTDEVCERHVALIDLVKPGDAVQMTLI